MMTARALTRLLPLRPFSSVPALSARLLSTEAAASSDAAATAADAAAQSYHAAAAFTPPPDRDEKGFAM